MPSSDFHVATGRRANRLSVAWVVALLVGVQVLAASGCVTPRAEVRATQVEKLESLRRALNEEDYSSTIGVVKALPEEGQAAIPILVETAINGKGYAPCCASWCLARMGVPGAAALTEVLVRGGPMPRRWARVELAQSENPLAMPILLMVLKDPDAKLRERVAILLMDLRAPESAEALGEALQDEFPEVRLAAVYALERMGKAAVKPLMAALNHSDPRIRVHGAYGLGQAGDSSAVPALIEALKDKDLDVRRSATSALSCVGDARAVQPLVAQLGDKDIVIGGVAVLALVNIGPSAVAVLVDCLKNGDPPACSNAILALGQIGDPRAIPALREFIRTHPGDPDADIAAGAIRAIQDSMSKRT